MVGTARLPVNDQRSAREGTELKKLTKLTKLEVLT